MLSLNNIIIGLFMCLEAVNVLPYTLGMSKSHKYMSCPVPFCYNQ